ncbi:MAG: ABC transporter substrate-binding protein [Fibromonadaceae bacterium]|jgi:NitT/TauT family transport system substrate-binding protein|nr:ABC transporter substrate-binding protein [Fibromonadaceae bacterium]
MTIFSKTLLLTAMLAFSLAGCKKETETKQKKVVKIAYLPITHAIPLLATAERIGENPEFQIELVKYSSWPELTDALNTGRVDGASVLVQLATKSKEQGVGLKAVALGHRDGNVVVVKKDINSVAELKGKTFAIPHRQSSHNILLRQMLSDSELSTEDVNVIEMAPPEMPAALAQGQIAGYCVAEPFGAKSVTLGAGKALYNSKQLWPNSICCSLVLTDDFINNYPETAKKFHALYHETSNYMSQNKDFATEVAKKYLTVDDSTLKLSLEWISFDSLTFTREVYSDLSEKMVKFGISANPPKYEDFVTTFDK